MAHPPVFSDRLADLLGIGWGVIATWWFGLFLGVPAACFARLGRAPTLDAGELIRPLAVVLGTVALFAATAGVIWYVLACKGVVVLRGGLAYSIPAEKHAAFLADAAAHLASYGCGFLGGVVLWAWIWRQRLLKRHRDPHSGYPQCATNGAAVQLPPQRS